MASHVGSGREGFITAARTSPPETLMPKSVLRDPTEQKEVTDAGSELKHVRDARAPRGDADVEEREGQLHTLGNYFPPLLLAEEKRNPRSFSRRRPGHCARPGAARARGPATRWTWDRHPEQ